MATTVEQVLRPEAPEGAEVQRHAGLVIVHARVEGMTPLLMNAMSRETLLNMRDKKKPAKNAAKPTPREEADGKLHRMADGRPHIPVGMLYSCLIGAGQFVRLDGKRQISTAKSSVLPGMLSIESAFLPLVNAAGLEAAWEVDIAQGRNPNGGEAVCIVRPRFDVWGFRVILGVDQQQMPVSMARELMDIAGSRVGLGDFRPRCKGVFGRFHVTGWEIE